MVRYSVEQRVFLYDSHVEYGSAGKCRRKFDVNFVMKEFPVGKKIHNLVNKLRTTGFLIDKKQEHKLRVLTEKLDNIGGRLEYTPRKSMKRLAQKTGVLKSCARTATQLLKPSSDVSVSCAVKYKNDCCTCVF
jgi:hypothetical protein